MKKYIIISLLVLVVSTLITMGLDISFSVFGPIDTLIVFAVMSAFLITGVVSWKRADDHNRRLEYRRKFRRTVW